MKVRTKDFPIMLLEEVSRSRRYKRLCKTFFGNMDLGFWERTLGWVYWMECWQFVWVHTIPLKGLLEMRVIVLSYAL
jgi:hypothetical protein